jgi:hypothetical protein
VDKKKEFPQLPEEFLELIAGDSPADYWTQIQKWAGNLLKDEGAFMKIIQSLAHLNQTQTQKNTNSQGGNPSSQGGNSGSQGGNSDSNKNGAAKNQIKQGSKSSNDNGADNNLTGDSLYDVFNSPAMRDIVKEVMKQKGKKRW